MTQPPRDRKSTRLNSSHANNSYAVFCLKKKRAMVHALSRESGISEDVLFNDFKHVYSKMGTLEYAFTVQKLPTFHSLSVDFFFNDTATTEIYTLSLHDALPICGGSRSSTPRRRWGRRAHAPRASATDRKSTRLNSSHANISYAVFCLKKKN